MLSVCSMVIDYRIVGFFMLYGTDLKNKSFVQHHYLKSIKKSILIEHARKSLVKSFGEKVSTTVLAM